MLELFSEHVARLNKSKPERPWEGSFISIGLYCDALEVGVPKQETLEAVIRAGISPNVISIIVEGGSKRPRTSRRISHEKLTQMFNDLGEAVSGLALENIFDNNFLQVSGQFAVSFVTGDVCISLPTFAFERSLFLDALIKLCKDYEVSYGFAVVAENALKALQWTSGLLTFDMSKEEWARVSAFGHSRHTDRAYLKDMLHDVYNLNFLSNSHMSRMVDGLPLQEWIERNEAGKIASLARDISIWELSEEQRIVARSALLLNGALLVPY